MSEKLQAKEVVGEPLPDKKPEELLSAEEAGGCVAVTAKVEDRLSTETGGSAVVEEDGPQLVDSGDSYFPNDDHVNDYSRCMSMDQVHSDEDDGSGDGPNNYYCHEFVEVERVAPQPQHREEGEALGWWVWS